MLRYDIVKNPRSVFTAPNGWWGQSDFDYTRCVTCDLWYYELHAMRVVIWCVPRIPSPNQVPFERIKFYVISRCSLIEYACFCWAFWSFLWLLFWGWLARFPMIAGYQFRISNLPCSRLVHQFHISFVYLQRFHQSLPIPNHLRIKKKNVDPWSIYT